VFCLYYYSLGQEFLSADDLDEILRAMGFRPSKEELMEILKESRVHTKHFYRAFSHVREKYEKICKENV
jgi:Ca2+-binding EF-hand superfamily protein